MENDKRLTPSGQKKQWTTWVVEEIEKYLHQFTNCNSSDKPTDYLRHHLWFGTVTFDPQRIRQVKSTDGHPYDDISYEWDQFNHLYNQIAKKLQRAVGRTLSKVMPFAMAVIDFEGSKLGFTPHSIEYIHIHFLMVVPPEQHEAASELFDEMTNNPTFPRLPLIDGIEIVPFDPKIRTVGELIAYVVKGESITQGSLGPDTIRLYPNPHKNSRRYTLKGTGRRRQALGSVASIRSHEATAKLRQRTG